MNIGGGTGGARAPQLSAYRGLAALAPPTGAENKATTTHPQTRCYILHAQTVAPSPLGAAVARLTPSQRVVVAASVLSSR